MQKNLASTDIEQSIYKEESSSKKSFNSQEGGLEHAYKIFISKQVTIAMKEFNRYFLTVLLIQELLALKIPDHRTFETGFKEINCDVNDISISEIIITQILLRTEGGNAGVMIALLG